jgi:hypothetical protein
MYYGFYPLMDSSLAYRVEIKAIKALPILIWRTSFIRTTCDLAFV